MTEHILAILFTFIKSVIDATGYAGIALLMAIESACIPLPSEVIMPFSGYLVSTGRFDLSWARRRGARGGSTAWGLPAGGGWAAGRRGVGAWGGCLLLLGAGWWVWRHVRRGRRS